MAKGSKMATKEDVIFGVFAGRWPRWPPEGIEAKRLRGPLSECFAGRMRKAAKPER
jgi:hypothetical protein